MNKEQRREQFYKDHPTHKTIILSNTEKKALRDRGIRKTIASRKAYTAFIKHATMSFLRTKGLTYREIGEKFNITKQRVAYILK
ncbi:MAG TPA: hypothetical protein ENI66_00510 [Candidatus Yonathbacteria bacterium]|nr:hypothetical protein [Candidatus Yonathbacteria bacterium]